jgi:hypothetical protein
MNNRLRDAGRRVRDQLRTGKVGEVLTKRGDVADLRRRVEELEDEMQEARRLNRRLAELTDVVQELLLPIAQRDEAKINEYLDRYSASL